MVAGIIGQSALSSIRSLSTLLFVDYTAVSPTELCLICWCRYICRCVSQKVKNFVQLCYFTSNSYENSACNDFTTTVRLKYKMYNIVHCPCSVYLIYLYICSTADILSPRKPKKEPTVITLSSDESEPETDKPLTGYDDTTAFVGGMHTDDSKNVADSQGRVLVNVNHPPDESDIFLTPKLAQTVKPHQVRVGCSIWKCSYNSILLFCHVYCFKLARMFILYCLE